ncbi:reverse transcriptase domain-containing protein, partial [Tanacetum coccineum]
MGIVVSTVHGAIKFHTPNGVGIIFSEHNSQRLMEEKGNSTNNGQGYVKDILSCIDTEEKIVIDDEYPEQKVTIGRQLPTRIKIWLQDLLRAHAYVFAWTTTYITGVPRTLIIGKETFNTKHQLNMFNHTEPTWVSNPIIVKKDDGKWKLRIDFININKACIREPHPLPAAELGAENLHKYRLKCFLDAYKGYHQIPMAEKDEEKTAFFIREGVFCYRRLPFGLKNAGATYQRLIDNVFGSQIRRNIKVNADDMVIKSDSEEEMLADIEETLGRLRAINLKLNPRKCSFRVEEGIYSGHLITKQGIRVDPSKVKAISALQPPKTVSEIQSFSKKLAALNRFLSKRAEKALPFMKTLKSCTSGKMVQWTTEANKAFRRMKECLESLPTMVIPTKVLSDMSIKQVLAKPEKLGRVAKWAIELGEHEIEFKGRNLTKGQILADFLIETSPTEREEEKNGEAKRKETEPENTWKLLTDGASSSDGSGAGLVLVTQREKNI